jgi:hypothetical protein
LAHGLKVSLHSPIGLWLYSVLCVEGWRSEVPHYPFQFVG